ncbi:MAG: hypothetical protein ACYC7F_00700 [Gemmatimonadaceae bacterium]
MGCHPLCHSSAVLLIVATAWTASAQDIAVAPLTRPALERDELARIGVLLDSAAPFYSTLRAPSRQLAWPVTSRRSFAVIAPEVSVGRNSELPYGFNDGALWAGRGVNTRVLAGMVVATGHLRLIAAPEVWTTQNAAYQTIPYPQNLPEQRSVWANPFHPAPNGIDLPQRFGASPLNEVSLGQSSLTIRYPKVEFGFSAENTWWGPGLQNALLWGSQGEGVPSFFVRTTSPVATRTGTWDAWYAVGALRESPYFDRLPANDSRSLGAFAVTWRPPRTRGVELGFARLVILAEKLSGAALLAPLGTVGHPNTTDSLAPGTRDQITSLWARWAAPGAGFEAWVEWARFEEPASLRDLLESPGHSQGYTVGLQWARPVRVGECVRVWAEGTYVEPSPSLRLRPEGASYVSRSVVQGFTVDGQPLGAGIGPGSSSQMGGADWLASRWRVGTYLSRIRTDNFALYTPVVPEARRPDLSLVNGVRVGREWKRLRVLLDWAHVVRLSYLFQANLKDPASGAYEGIDLINNAVTLTFSTLWPRGTQ